MTRSRANLLLLLAGAIWGMGFIAQSGAMHVVSPWTFTAARFLLATLTLLPLAIRESRRASRPMSGGEWRGFMLCGLMLLAGSVLQQFGLVTTTVTNSGFLTGLYVVMTPVLALLVFRSRPHWVIWPAAAGSLFGILLIGGGSLGRIGFGDWLTVGAAAGFAAQIMLTGWLTAATGRPFTLCCVQFAVTFVVAMPLALGFEMADIARLPAIWPNVVYGGCISAGLAFTLQTVGQHWTTAPQAAIFLSSESVFAALFAAVLLGERIAPLGYVGCFSILLAMLAVEIVPVWRQDRTQDCLVSPGADPDAQRRIG